MMYDDFLYTDEELYDEDGYLMHYGVAHDENPPTVGSGRYPWGSGENSFQHPKGDFLAEVRRLQAKYPGISNKELAERMGCFSRTGKTKGQPSTGEFQRRLSAAIQAEKAAKINEAIKLKDEGLGATEIAEKMGLGKKGESTVRSWLAKGRQDRAMLTYKNSEILKDYVDKYKYVDIGPGVDTFFGINKNRFQQVVYDLENQGYRKQYIKMDLVGTDHQLTITCLTPPDVDGKELYEHRFDIRFPYQEHKIVDIKGDISALGLGEIVSVDPKRIGIDYASPEDGLVRLRRGVDDVSLGAKDFAQIRIAVDGTHYVKGMAVPSDDLPPGIDILVSTNKKEGTPLLVKDDPNAKQVLKAMKTKSDGSIDWDNPFGATIDRDSEIMTTTHKYLDKDGNEKTSAVNVLREAGDWDEYSRSLSPQLLSKQYVGLAERQLTMKVDQKRKELDELLTLDNPTVKKHLLLAYADKCDASAEDLKAAPFRGQRTCVLLPCDKLSHNEVYAPAFKDGTKVVLVRFPYAGPFESPLLTVRNTGSPAEKLFPKTQIDAIDAIAVNANKLQQMSGADTDGDTALVIPQTPSSRLYYKKDTLPELRNFDTKEAYPGYEGMKVIKHQTAQTEMGKTTNLIMDMTLKNADPADVAMAVKHSMVIIDAEKHNLNWKLSAEENHIRELKHRYQDTGDGKTGAGTVITRAGSEIDIPERKQWRPGPNTIDEHGDKIYEETGKTYNVGKLNLKGIDIPKVGKVNLTYDSDTDSLYYLRKDQNNPRKNIRVYPDDIDIPANLRGVNMKQGGWVNLNEDRKTGRQYYLRWDSDAKKSVRVYPGDEDLLDVQTKGRTQKATRMSLEKDAFNLTSGGSRDNPGHPMERVYANFANDMKDLAREARLEYLKAGNQVYNKEAKKQYAEEVASLEKKLQDAHAHSPYERQAQIMANRELAIKKIEYPNMTKEQKKKMRGQAITGARARLGSKKPLIEVTDKEYAAIRAGAINETTLKDIMNHCNMDSLKAQATPRTAHQMDAAKIAFAKRLAARTDGKGNKLYSAAQIADIMGFSASTISKHLNE